jgi:hypothetical protein
MACWRALDAGRVAVAAGREGRLLPGARFGDEFAVADGVVVDGELHQPKEQQPAVARGAAAESEHELVEVALQVLWLNGTLVSSQ